MKSDPALFLYIFVDLLCAFSISSFYLEEIKLCSCITQPGAALAIHLFPCLFNIMHVLNLIELCYMPFIETVFYCGQ